MNDPLDEAFAAYLRACDEGRLSSREEFLKQFPDIADQLGELMQLADSLGDFVDERMVRGQAALVLREVDADAVLDLFRGRSSLEPTPATVRVRVLNGSGSSNQAWDVAQDLQTAGFALRGTDNLRGDPLQQTEIRYMPGQQAQAQLLSRYLIATPKLVEDTRLTAAPVELVTGTDYRGLVEPGDEPSAPTITGPTSTTAAPTTTSTTTTSTTRITIGIASPQAPRQGALAFRRRLRPPGGVAPLRTRFYRGSTSCAQGQTDQSETDLTPRPPLGAAP